MATLKEMLEEQSRIKSELQRMESDETVTEEESGDYRDTLVARWEQLDEATKPLIARMERIRGITRAADNPENREDGDGAGNGRRGPEFMRRMDVFADLDKVRGGVVTRTDLVARAATAVEMHNKRGLLPSDRAQEATVKAQRSAGIARHMLLTGYDEYVDAFRAYLEDPTGEGALSRGSGMLLTPSANGGYLLPYVLDPTIVLASSGSANPFRRIGRVVQTTSNAWQGVSSAGVNAQWLGEAAAATDATPTIGQIQIWPQKGAVWVYGSYEARDDEHFADSLPMMLADAKDRLEENAFAVGTGGTGNSVIPKGVLAGLGTGQRVTAAGGTGGAFYGTGSAPASDIYNLQAKLPPRFRLGNNVGWVANITNINKIRALDQYGGSSFWANFGSDTPEQLLGKPIYESSSITSATGTGTGTGNAVLVFGAWDNFIIVDRIGTSMLYEPMIKATGSQVPTGQAGWFMFWRVGSDVSTSSAFAYLANGA